MAAHDEEGAIIEAPDEGIIGEHPRRRQQPFFASTATAATFNVLGFDLEPIACLHLGDILFDFDSSFVLPSAARILAGLAGLREKRRNKAGELPPISVFGHADPVGDIEYNKQLSGRRAKAIYGVLLHDADVWESLYNSPHGGDNWQTNASVKGLRASLGLPSTAARKDVFRAYMKTLIPAPVTKADFLGKGADKDGKADFQGCSKFNPLVLLSTEDNKTLTTAQRNAANMLNRRVVIYLFRPGIKLTPSLWPCPAALAPSAGCKKRLFLDATKRMTPGSERREHTRASDTTFACRFYDRIGGPSPCERVLKIYRIRLFDSLANPLPAAPFFLISGNMKLLGRTKSDAFVTIRDLKVPTSVTVFWSKPKPDDTPLSPPPKETDKFEFVLEIFVDFDDESETKAAEQRLHNIGFVGAVLADRVRAFQTEYKDRFGLTPTGVLDPKTKAALKTVNDDCDPLVKPAPAK